MRSNEHHAVSKPKIIVRDTKEIFISQLPSNGITEKEKCEYCSDWFDSVDKHFNQTNHLTKLIERKQHQINYAKNKDKVNARRKLNYRQPWKNRADNPANKRGNR